MNEREFLREYQQYYENILMPTQNEVREVTRYWHRTDFWQDRNDVMHDATQHTQHIDALSDHDVVNHHERMVVPSPIYRIKSRIKRPESVVDKIYRKPEFFHKGLSLESINEMNDTFGVRVVCYFIGDLVRVHKLLMEESPFEIAKHERPTAYQSKETLGRLGILGDLKRRSKGSGYLSLHYILRVKDSMLPSEQRPWFELQLRTMVEDIWGEIEHQLGYKPQADTIQSASRQFLLVANYLSAVDEHFEHLRAELQHLQLTSEISEESILGPENLPRELNELRLRPSRREIDGLLKLLTSRGISTVKQFRQIANQVNCDLINNRYFIKQNRGPMVFETVACLANMKEEDSLEERTRKVDSQIDYNAEWYKWQYSLQQQSE